MATLTISFTPASPAPVNGYTVRYRAVGTIPYFTVSPSPTTSPVLITGLLAATEYEGDIQSDCGTGVSTLQTFKTCTCAVGFARSVNGYYCEKTETTPVTVTHSNYCLALSNNPAYSSLFTRIYNPGFNYLTIEEQVASNPADVYAQLYDVAQWTGNYPADGTGPMNRAGVWIDSDCNGVKNALTAGEQTTVAYSYFNSGAPKTIHVGVGGDNQFTLKVNGSVVAVTDPGTPTNVNHFKIWHIFPVDIVTGFNDFNIIATGDGSVNDAVAMVVYNNTAAEIAAATQDSNLNILFNSSTLRGSHIDIATCPFGYSLDTSGGQGNYICRKITQQPCGGA